ncbi:DGQHR domain [Stenotrophomonas maltophilia]|nr:DGQHR domain [Stenotrophomonas maltophilia]
MHSYIGIRVRQREDSDISFILLSAPASEIYAWSQADDIKLDKVNVQRSLVDSRWKQVKKFFQSYHDNIVPTSITVAFDDSIAAVADASTLIEGIPAYSIEDIGPDGLVRITFPRCVQKISYIIDGQHRLKGMSEYDKPLFVPVCLFPSLSRLERAFQFVTINNKSHKVPTDNVKALISNFSAIETDLRKRLTAATITVPKLALHIDIVNEDPEGPFHKTIAWVNNRYPDGKHVIAPAAIENSIKAIQAGFKETREDDADAITVLSAIWRTIFSHYNVTLQNIETFENLIMKATIQTITQMVVERLVTQFDPVFSEGGIASDDADEARKVAERLIKGIPVEYWQKPWVLKSLDTSAGRQIIKDSIRRLKNSITKIRPGEDFDWVSGNPLLDAKMIKASGPSFDSEEDDV